MANKHRGEAAIHIGDRTYTLRPTFTALVEIEERTGMGLIELAQCFFDQKVRVKDVVSVIFAGIRAAENDWPEEDVVANAVVENGLANVIEPVGAFLADALAGGQFRSAVGNAKPAARGRKKTPTRSAASPN